MRGSELIAEFVKHSPFAKHLGIEARSIADDHAVLALPFSEEVVTIGADDGALVATGLVTYKLG